MARDAKYAVRREAALPGQYGSRAVGEREGEQDERWHHAYMRPDVCPLRSRPKLHIRRVFVGHDERNQQRGAGGGEQPPVKFFAEVSHQIRTQRPGDNDM